MSGDRRFATEGSPIAPAEAPQTRQARTQAAPWVTQWRELRRARPGELGSILCDPPALAQVHPENQHAPRQVAQARADVRRHSQLMLDRAIHGRRGECHLPSSLRRGFRRQHRLDKVTPKLDTHGVQNPRRSFNSDSVILVALVA